MIGFDLVKTKALKNVIAVIDNDEYKDLSREIGSNIDDVKFIEASSQDGLDIIRHSSAHLMAAAIQRLYPQTKFTIGPSIDNAFYYDIDLDQKISEDDFAKIEAEMKKIVDEDVKFVRKEVSKNEALSLFKDNEYKCEIIKELPDNAVITLYYLGDYVDLCRGPHVPSSRYLKYFRLTKVSGAY
jgi:threonyl-tRNA synthetase